MNRFIRYFICMTVAVIAVHMSAMFRGHRVIVKIKNYTNLNLQVGIHEIPCPQPMNREEHTQPTIRGEQYYCFGSTKTISPGEIWGQTLQGECCAQRVEISNSASAKIIYVPPKGKDIAITVFADPSKPPSEALFIREGIIDLTAEILKNYQNFVRRKGG